MFIFIAICLTFIFFIIMYEALCISSTPSAIVSLVLGVGITAFIVVMNYMPNLDTHLSIEKQYTLKDIVENPIGYKNKYTSIIGLEELVDKKSQPIIDDYIENYQGSYYKHKSDIVTIKVMSDNANYWMFALTGKPEYIYTVVTEIKDMSEQGVS